jgi:hypothetical protein
MDRERAEKGNPLFEFPMRWDLMAIMYVCGNLQLALRHPQNDRDTRSAQIARETADALIEVLRSHGFVAHAECAELGYNAENDPPPEEPEPGPLVTLQ